MVGQVLYKDGISEPIIQTNVNGGQTIILPRPQIPQIKVGKVYVIGSNKKPKVVNVGTENAPVLDFYFSKNKIIELKENE